MTTQYFPENEIPRHRPSNGVDDYLALVSRPTRYIDSEVNSVKKDLSGVRLKFGLAFPDVYEVGMSHLGLHILYKILNMLKLGSIPLLSKDRDETHPVIIGGGPIAFNPEPIAEFFDAFVLGDGEEVILEIADIVIGWKYGKTREREELLKRLARVEGVYVPSLFDAAYNADGTVKEIIPLLKDYTGINKRIVPDLNKLPLPLRPVVPFPQIVHDHLSVEINRGCTRGCRFCQAGMIYRPNRERSPENIIKIVEGALKNTGYD